MNKIIILFFLIYSTKVFSQYGIVEDKDGYVNIRSEQSAKSRIIDTLHSGRILYILFLDEQKGDWLDCSFARKGKNVSGYIHKSKVKLLTSFKKIKEKVVKNQVSFLNQKLNISITKEPFIAKNNKLKYRKRNPKSTEETYLQKINGKDFYGTDGDLPREQYGKSIIKYDSIITILKTETFFCPNLESHELYWDEKNNIYYLTTTNGDGAGAYVALWVIKEGKIIDIETDIPF